MILGLMLWAAATVTPVVESTLLEAIAHAAKEAYASVAPGPDHAIASDTFARTLVGVGRCEEAFAVLRDDPLVHGGRIEKSVFEAVFQDDLQCAAKLSELLVERSDDPVFLPAGQDALRRTAGSVMLAAGRAKEGAAVIAEAEKQLSAIDPSGSSPSPRSLATLWQERVKALTIYRGTQLFAEKLGQYASELMVSPLDAGAPTVNAMLEMLVAEGRLDLAQSVRRSGPSHLYLSMDQLVRIAAENKSVLPHCPPAFSAFPKRSFDNADLKTALDKPQGRDRLSALNDLAHIATMTKRCSASR